MNAAPTSALESVHFSFHANYVYKNQNITSLGRMLPIKISLKTTDSNLDALWFESPAGNIHLTIYHGASGTRTSYKGNHIYKNLNMTTQVTNSHGTFHLIEAELWLPVGSSHLDNLDLKLVAVQDDFRKDYETTTANSLNSVLLIVTNPEVQYSINQDAGRALDVDVLLVGGGSGTVGYTSLNNFPRALPGLGGAGGGILEAEGNLNAGSYQIIVGEGNSTSATRLRVHSSSGILGASSARHSTNGAGSGVSPGSAAHFTQTSLRQLTGANGRYSQATVDDIQNDDRTGINGHTMTYYFFTNRLTLNQATDVFGSSGGTGGRAGGGHDGTGDTPAGGTNAGRGGNYVGSGDAKSSRRHGSNGVANRGGGAGGSYGLLADCGWRGLRAIGVAHDVYPDTPDCDIPIDDRKSAPANYHKGGSGYAYIRFDF